MAWTSSPCGCADFGVMHDQKNAWFQAWAALLNSFRRLELRASKVAQETLQSLRTHASPYVDDAGERLTTAERYLVEKVQKQPLTSTLAALGIGVLVGLILAGGRSR